ncbi:Tn3 family transposase [Pilimelia columellifera]|uniref:Tn3 transposase DDE domain-containing protein n=1 Tax=Pilimelia columellifera subsp. columellifera TaxID=706583 RepID=A0ABN3NU15_9ACTN
MFISDTGSYSDMVFGLLKLLGVDYRPELAGLPDQRLWRTVRAADYGPLDTASRSLIDLEKIKRHWSDILRIAASVHTGAVAASEVMRILQRGGNPTQLGDALAHFGRIFKTLHVLSSSTGSSTGATSSGCATCRRNAIGWPSTSATAVAANSARSITRG